MQPPAQTWLTVAIAAAMLASTALLGRPDSTDFGTPSTAPSAAATVIATATAQALPTKRDRLTTQRHVDSRPGVNGEVIDAEGKPVADALVWIDQPTCDGLPFDFRPPAHTTRSAADGSFRLAIGDLACNQRIGATAIGHTPTHRSLASAGSAPIQLQLQPGEALLGWVVDGNGQAVAGARVRATTTVVGCEFAAITQTDKHGEFALLVDGDQAAELRITAQGFAVHSTHRVPSGQAQRFELSAHSQVLGVLHGPVGFEVTGIDVERPLGETFTRVRDNAAELDGERFAIDGLSAGDYRLRLRGRGFGETFSPVFTVGPTTPAQLELVLAPEARLHGLLTNSDGSAAPQVVLIARPASAEPGSALQGALLASYYGGPRAIRTSTDQRGAFEFTGLAAGRHQLVAVFDQRETELGEVSLAAADNHQQLRLPAAGQIRGELIDQLGHARSTATIELSAAHNGSRIGRTTTDPDGSFEFVALPPGEYQVSWRTPGVPAMTAVTTRLFVQAGTITNCELETSATGELIGVVNPSSQQLERLVLTASDGAQLALTTDTNGRFTCSDLAAGEYRLQAQLRAAPNHNRKISIRPGSQQVSIDLPLGQIDGTVLDPLGRPSTGARITLFEGSAAVATTVADPSGRFHFHHLGTGVWILRAESGTDHNYGETRVSLTAGQDHAKVSLNQRAAAGLRGMVRTRDDAVPVGFARFTITSAQGHKHTLPVDASGAFESRALPPGHWQLLVTHPGFHPYRRELNLESGCLDLELLLWPIE